MNSIRITLASIKPRNPVAQAGRARRAGAHRASPGALRQQARRTLRAEIDHTRPSP